MIRQARSVYLIAKVSLIELLREKFFLISVLLGFIVILMSLVLGQMSVNEHDRILVDLGLSSIELSSVIMCIFLGSYLIAKEIDRQTCLLVLARPVTRLEFIMGKVLSVIVLFTGSIFLLALLIYGLLGKWDFLINLISASFSIWCKCLVVLLFTILVSQVLQPAVATFVGISLYLMGHWIPDVKFFAEKSKDPNFIFFAKSLDWIVPNFYKFNWKSFDYVEFGVGWIDIIWTTTYVLGWVLLFVLFINISFRRRDIA